MIISAVTLAVGCAYALFFIKTGLGVPCPFHLLTGLNCPGCGVTRMCVSLLKLDLRSAFEANAVLLCLTPVLLVFLGFRIYRLIRYGKNTGGKASAVLSWTIIGVLLAWGIVRNLIGM